jgi:hypothetical protein
MLFASIVLFPMLVRGQSSVGVAVDNVVDDRFSEGMLASSDERWRVTGSLRVRVKLTGSSPSLTKAKAARLIVKEARDDRGTNLAKGWKQPDFLARDMNQGVLEISLDNPARAASSASVKGTVELYVPSRDPEAIVTIPKALSKLDSPLTSTTLKTANIRITPLSPAKYAEEKKKQKVTEKDLEEIRAQGKAHGVSEKEIELAIGLAQAMEQMGSEPTPENAVILSGSSKDFERINSIEVLGADKKPIHITGRTTSTKGDFTVMVMEASGAIPPGAALQLTLLTAKSRVSVPFELKKVVLP